MEEPRHEPVHHLGVAPRKRRPRRAALLERREQLTTMQLDVSGYRVLCSRTLRPCDLAHSSSG